MSATGTSNSGFAGQQSPSDSTSEFNKNAFLIKQMLGLVRTATLVQVKAVTNDGDISPIGTVDVLPLVKLLDGNNNASSHGTLYKLPYCRIQGGSNAVILDPQVDDIGIAIFSDRDISSVVANQAEANPGSLRRFSMADGIYLFTCLSDVTPEQYIQFNADGITIHDKNGHSIIMSSTGIQLNGPIDLNGNVTSVGTFKNNGVNTGSTHVHGGVTAGAANTAVPH